MKQIKSLNLVASCVLEGLSIHEEIGDCKWGWNEWRRYVILGDTTDVAKEVQERQLLKLTWGREGLTSRVSGWMRVFLAEKMASAKVLSQKRKNEGHLGNRKEVTWLRMQWVMGHWWQTRLESGQGCVGHERDFGLHPESIATIMRWWYDHVCIYVCTQANAHEKIQHLWCWMDSFSFWSFPHLWNDANNRTFVTVVLYELHRWKCVS